MLNPPSDVSAAVGSAAPSVFVVMYATFLRTGSPVTDPTPMRIVALVMSQESAFSFTNTNDPGEDDGRKDLQVYAVVVVDIEQSGALMVNVMDEMPNLS